MSGETDVTVVTTLVCFFILHARLRAQRAPDIPCALSFEGRISWQTSDASRRENVHDCLNVIARSKATKQSTLTGFAAPWIASLRSQ
jgi:hypothetical protein